MVDPDDPSKLLGLLGRRELVAAYTSEIDALRAPAELDDGEAEADRPRGGP